MLKFYQFILVLQCSLFLACESNIKETPNGLKFRVVKSGDGVLPKKDDAVLFNFKLIDSNDSVWRDTYLRGLPMVERVRDTSKLHNEKKLKQMLRMVSRGDSIIVDFSVSEYYKDVESKPIPSHIDTTLRLSYHVKIDTIMTLEAYRYWLADKLAKRMATKIQKDAIIIDEFLESKNITAEKTTEGVRYVITREVSSVKAQSKQIAVVNYVGYFLNGNCFVSNVKPIAQQNGLIKPDGVYEPLKVIIDESLVISGWHSSLKVLGKGDKGIFYIPSPLAYGDQGSDDIKENSILVFDIEVLDVRDTVITDPYVVDKTTARRKLLKRIKR